MIDPGWGMVTVVGIFCTGLYTIANNKVSKKVNTDVCHVHVDNLKSVIESVEKKVDANKADITARLDDVKEDTRDIRAMIKNGK